MDNSDIDVVAVSWGPQAKSLVADVACRGTQACKSKVKAEILGGFSGETSAISRISRRISMAFGGFLAPGGH